MTPSLPAEPHRATPYALRVGSSGWAVYGLQAGLRRVGLTLELDGDFGPATETAVETFQRRHLLGPDGIAGMVTQRELATEVVGRRLRVPGIPDGLGLSLVDGEGGYLFGAVNWSVAGGVDCGLVQRRVTGPPFALAALREAFEPFTSTRLSLAIVQRRAQEFAARPAVQTAERAWRLALLAHNWPFAAEELASGRSLPDRTAHWIPAGVRFPDGTPVVTWRDWCEFYALGGRHGEARMARFVQSWPNAL